MRMNCNGCSPSLLRKSCSDACTTRCYLQWFKSPDFRSSKYRSKCFEDFFFSATHFCFIFLLLRNLFALQILDNLQHSYDIKIKTNSPFTERVRSLRFFKKNLFGFYTFLLQSCFIKDKFTICCLIQILCLIGNWITVDHNPFQTNHAHYIGQRRMRGTED